MTPEEMENAFERLFAAQGLLTGKVLDLTESMETMREQAEADRAILREAMGEMRTAVGAMLDVAESMAANVTVLTQMQQTTYRRVDAIERRVDRLEGNDPEDT